jgi:hypothetical protein
MSHEHHKPKKHRSTEDLKEIYHKKMKEHE